LHPTGASYDDPGLSPNARSCVLKVDAGAKSILLAGDIEAAQEAQLLMRGAGRLQADVLLAPHHGSGTSSTPAFLLAVHPELALFQVGYRNRYRHPKPEVFERYRALGIKRLRTDWSGALTLQMGPTPGATGAVTDTVTDVVADTVTVTQYRLQHARYWYGR
jgi:competence protein ComEC